MTVTVLVGTTKGAFLLRGDADRTGYEITGPHLPGNVVYAMAHDGRAGRSRIWAGAQNAFYGVNLAYTDDGGATWTQPEKPAIAFPPDVDATLENVWQIVPGPEDEPDVLWAGAEPASLFRTDDAGATWELVRGLWDHPHRPTWQPGGGGLCLHTVLPDPADRNRMYVAISAAGVYRTDDGGRTWTPRNSGIRAEFLPDPNPEYGQCVHKVDFDAAGSRVLWAQNHGGLYRSEDGGDTWADIANGVPSDFGFPIVAHPSRPGTAYVIPLEGAGYRATPDGKARVFRTTDAGASWHPLTNGLPQDNAHFTVLRDGFTTDGLDPAGLYFGTRSGEVWASADEGESWRCVAAHLPPVTCVKTAAVA